MLPKRREKQLLTEELPNETIIYDTANHQVHCLSAVATLVWQHCNGRTPEAKMAEMLRTELHIQADETLVRMTLEKLVEAGLLKENPVFAATTSRREAAKLLVKFGIAPLVATIASPAVAQAASGTGGPAGTPCTASNQCASGCCCNSNGLAHLKGTCGLDKNDCGGDCKP